MKVTIRAVQASVTVLDNAGTEVFSYAVENSTFILDASKALEAVSALSHLFKQLDASHNTGVFVNAQGERERAPEPAAPSERVSVFERPRNVQDLLSAASAFQTATTRRELTDVQHDCCMEVYDAMKLARHDASSENVRDLCKIANEFLTSLGEPQSAREARHADKLRAAIAAI